MPGQTTTSMNLVAALETTSVVARFDRHAGFSAVEFGLPALAWMKHTGETVADGQSAPFALREIG